MSKCEIPQELYDRLEYIGILNSDSVRDHNIGKSDYATSGAIIQPWSYIADHNLNYWEGDIIKRITRRKEGESRVLDLEKIKHICDELIRQEQWKKN